MSILNVQPAFQRMLKRWQKARDCYDGQEAVKEKGLTYLPATSGMYAMGMGTGQPGKKAYDAYRTRAVYPDLFQTAVDGIVGLMHRKPATFNLTPSLEPLRERATTSGENLELLLRRINTQQLITGRLGLLGDILTHDDAAGVQQVFPNIVLYNAETIRNWDDVNAEENSTLLRFAVLDESQYVLNQDFTWELVEQYRMLALVKEGKLDAQGGTYMTKLAKEQDLGGVENMTAPVLRGKTLNVIPFSFINAADIASDPDLPPLEGAADLSLTIYRGEADYRQGLFMQGQDTLVVIGGDGEDDDAPMKVGANARINVPVGGDAKYVGVESTGLAEQRQALENDYKRGEASSGRVVNNSSGGNAESGDALRIRVSAQTATLPVIAKAAASGLEQVLKALAIWYGENPDDVSVEPNLEFADVTVPAADLVQLIAAKNSGAPLSYESIHEWQRTHGLTEMSYEDEIALLDKEEPFGIAKTFQEQGRAGQAASEGAEDDDMEDEELDEEGNPIGPGGPEGND